MEPCQICGAALSADAQWCGQCYAIPTRARVTVGGPRSAMPQIVGAQRSVMSPVSVMNREASLPVPMVKTRWRKTSTTFGPIGRVIATLALVVPFLVLLVLGVLSGGLELGGAAIWGVIIMPWGLKDTWRAGQVPVR